MITFFLGIFPLQNVTESATQWAGLAWPPAADLCFDLSRPSYLAIVLRLRAF